MRLTLALIVVCATASADTRDRKLTVVEATIPELQAALRSGRVTSRELVLQYLARIATYEDKLNAVIAVNPRALEEADALDRERQPGARASFAARCTESPSRSRTTSTPRTCRPPGARWPSPAWCRRTRRR